jgi:hypothetical protein
MTLSSTVLAETIASRFRNTFKSFVTALSFDVIDLLMLSGAIRSNVWSSATSAHALLFMLQLAGEAGAHNREVVLDDMLYFVSETVCENLAGPPEV